MKILIVTDFKVFKYKDSIYCGTQFTTIAKRYKNAFGEICLCARLYVLDTLPVGYECIDNILSAFYGVDNLSVIFNISYERNLRRLVNHSDLVVIRSPSALGLVAAFVAKRLNKPYLSELMGDAWDAYWNHGLWGKLIAPIFYILTKKIVRDGNYALYVTERWLQCRYPCLGLTTYASNVYLNALNPESLDIKNTLLKNFNEKRLLITTIGAVNVRHKGHEFMIRAIPVLNKLNVKLHYKIIGGGDNSFLFNLAKRLGVLDQVEFAGRQSLESILSILDFTDIYVHPSLQEGLPRSVIEALSRACLVIGSKVAGTPEIIESECIVKCRSVSDLVNKILYLRSLSHEDRMSMCKRNFERSKDFLSSVLDDRRNLFYNKIKKDILYDL